MCIFSSWSIHCRNILGRMTIKVSSVVNIISKIINCWAVQSLGSVVECSPATRAARVRIPDDAKKLYLICPGSAQSQSHHVVGFVGPKIVNWHNGRYHFFLVFFKLFRFYKSQSIIWCKYWDHIFYVSCNQLLVYISVSCLFT